MRSELIGESLKSAISIKLGELFDNPIRYKENITSPKYPNFSIIQVNNNSTPLQTYTESALNNDLERIQLDYLFNIQYRLEENTEHITNLRQQLDAIGLKLVSQLKTIDLDVPIYTKNRRYEITDGVLQFFFNVTIFATLEQQNDDIQGTLSLEENIKEE